MRKCPHCSEDVREDVDVCTSCGGDLLPGDAATTDVGEASPTARAGAGTILVVSGGLAAAVGSFLPWISSGGPEIGVVSASGISPAWSGRVTLVLGLTLVVLAAAGVFVRGVSRATSAALLVLGAILGFVAIIQFRDVSAKTGELEAISGVGSAWVGTGLYVVILGSLAVLIGATGLVLRED